MYGRIFWHQRDDGLSFDAWKVQLSDEYWEHYGCTLMEAMTAASGSDGMRWHKRLANLWCKEYDFDVAARMIHALVIGDNVVNAKRTKEKRFPARRVAEESRPVQGPEAGHQD